MILAAQRKWVADPSVKYGYAFVESSNVEHVEVNLRLGFVWQFAGCFFAASKQKDGEFKVVSKHVKIQKAQDAVIKSLAQLANGGAS
jgi:hypothetical protein